MESRANLTSLKSYLYYQTPEGQKQICSVSNALNNEAKFLFEIPIDSLACDWVLNIDFNYRVTEFSVMSGEIHLDSNLEISSNSMSYHASFIAPYGKCHIKIKLIDLTLDESMEWIRFEYKQRCFNIQQLQIEEQDFLRNNKLLSGQNDSLKLKNDDLIEYEEHIEKKYNDIKHEYFGKKERMDQFLLQQSQLINDNEQLKKLNNQLILLQKELTEANSKQKQEYDDLLSHQTELLNHDESELACIKNDEAEKEQELLSLQQELKNKQGHIELLLESDRELHRIYQSRSWKLMKFFWAIRDFLLPKGSRRRLVLKLIVKFFCHPIQFIKKINRNRVKRFMDGLSTGNIADTTKRLNDCMQSNDVRTAPVSIIEVNSSYTKIEQYDRFSVPTSSKPLVSIIIPVYNQFHYTYACLKTISRIKGNIPYEVIIANDCSTDLTSKLTEAVSGVTVITNEHNLRFLKNCNHAAESAKGKYILFLNNDTQVQEDWLSSLVQLIESDSSIGMVGSKLIYPDGRLQEAGGILWKDGSAWNYGHKQDPAAPEYNYVKDVDYISGASIMIRTDLWKQIGGFDELFAPAYCEDSDLAFEVRKAGFRVVYQPLSVVVHFEGISNGTDVTNGQKAYQIVNQKKFYEKWKEVLNAENNPNGVDPFRARDRSIHKKTLLMVDHYVPQYDKDAGSRTVFEYLKLFVRQGYNVKFIGDNFYQHQPYTTVLQQLGIEVLYGPWYAAHWQEWVKDNGSDIQYAFLNRPHIAVKYIDWIRNNTPARIVYYGHDLHFLRISREYQVIGKKSLLEEAEDWKVKELSLMRKADMSYYPSEVEVEIIKKEDPAIQVKAIPSYLFEDVKEEPYDYSARKDLMFIGGFNHDPNVDAVLWLKKEIMPALVERLPDIKVHIIGSNAPKEVIQLADKNLIYDGCVSDEQLADFYHQCRISVVPLRYGAGIKGKVVEAMEMGMPVMTTSVGAEGIEDAESILCIEDDPVQFAHKLASLYEDEAGLKDRSVQSYQYVKDHYSEKNAIDVISSEFDMKGDEQE